jgi:hypothetical protein
LGIEAENEILTDIATVYLGLGKLLLNGCRESRSYTQSNGQHEKTTKKEIRVGYLDIEQLSLVYRLVCSMRQIAEPASRAHLNTVALSSIAKCDSEFGQYYLEKFYSPGFSSAVKQQQLKAMENLQDQLSELGHHLKHIDMVFIKAAKSHMVASHQAINEFQNNSNHVLNSPNPVSNYLNGILKRTHDTNSLSKFEEGFQLASNHSDFALEVYERAWESPNNLTKPNETDFSSTECPIDGTTINVPSGHKLLCVTCPTCGYKFRERTFLIYPPFSSQDPSSPKRPPTPKNTILESPDVSSKPGFLSRLFRRTER